MAGLSLPDATAALAERRRAPVVAVAIIELVSDGLLDSAFPFPLDTIVVVALVAVLAWALLDASPSGGSTGCPPSSGPATPTSSGARRRLGRCTG